MKIFRLLERSGYKRCLQCGVILYINWLSPNVLLNLLYIYLLYIYNNLSMSLKTCAHFYFLKIIRFGFLFVSSQRTIFILLLAIKFAWLGVNAIFGFFTYSLSNYEMLWHIPAIVHSFVLKIVKVFLFLSLESNNFIDFSLFWQAISIV